MIVDMNELRGGMEVGSVGVDRLLRYQSLTPSTHQTIWDDSLPLRLQSSYSEPLT